ncbi:MAG: glycoside hydrolase family 3 N-terminal domain-containing protein [Saprospiraceae bacterium]
MFNAHTAAYNRELQRMAIEETRMGIPLLFGYDVIHGYRTIFPISLGEAASWNLEAIEKSARIAAEEASAAGLHWTFAPMVDIARDPRWGRIMEGAGEDTYLGTRVAEARVRGFQGDDLSLPNTILACAKHYAAYGAAQAGRDYHTVDISERTLREVYLPPFQRIAEIGAATFMNSFNELDGIPATGNKHLLDDILRKEWGFEGFVVTDYTSINEMVLHGCG